MINPSTINLSTLPSLPLEKRCYLPTTPCIYFAVDSWGNVQYIGMAKNLWRRWTNHHKLNKLRKIYGIRLAWLEVSDYSLLPDMEVTLINWFKPPLNKLSNSSTNTTKLSMKQDVVSKKTVKNCIKRLLDSGNETRYQFWKKTGLAQNTAYRLYDDPEYIPGKEVLEKICRVYNWIPKDFIVYE